MTPVPDLSYAAVRNFLAIRMATSSTAKQAPIMIQSDWLRGAAAAIPSPDPPGNPPPGPPPGKPLPELPGKPPSPPGKPPSGALAVLSEALSEELPLSLPGRLPSGASPENPSGASPEKPLWGALPVPPGKPPPGRPAARAHPAGVAARRRPPDLCPGRGWSDPLVCLAATAPQSRVNFRQKPEGGISP